MKDNENVVLTHLNV